MPRIICHPSTVDDYLNDALSPEDEAALEQHLNECAECRQRMAAAAGSGDDWTAITSALRPDELDEGRQTVADQLLWPLTLLGPTDDPRMLGRIGPFEVSGCVGVGGMGVVFKARDPALDRYVAVKVLSPQLAASESARSRFEREAKAAAAVVHDNVIAVHQVSEYQGLPYLVMPYLPGPSLEERLQRHGPMAPVAALRIARQVAAGLKAAHAQGLIHRDIKPANILLSGDTERALLTDFGLARAVDDASITRAGSLAGTPQFMAPEQARGETTDERSDLFSLGALLFAMLTGRPPVPHVSGMETVRKVGNERPPQLSEVLEDVPRSLERTVAALHCFSPAQRMSSAAAAERQLENLLATAGRHPLQRRRDLTVPASVTGRLRQLSVRSRWMFVVSLAALVTLLLVMIPSFLWPQPPGSATESFSDREPPDAVVIPAADRSIAAGPVQTRPVDAPQQAIELRDSPDLSPAFDNRALNGSPNDSPRDMPRDVSNEVSHDALDSMPERAAASSAPPREITIDTLPFDDADSLQLDELLRSIETQLDTLENR